jgi:hypothetical protein
MRQFYDIHKNAVDEAVKTGKPVPPEVLKDYPELAKSASAEVPPVKPQTMPEVVKPPIPPQPPAPPTTPSVPPQTPKDAITELVGALKEGKGLQAPTRAMQHKARAQRTAIAIQHMQNPNLSTAEAFQRAKGAYAGNLPRPGLTPPAISDPAKQLLRDTVRTTKAIPDNFVFTRTTADDALQKVFKGELPTKGEIELLDELFGPELGNALKGLRPLKGKIIENALDVLNLPRSLKASWDLSAPLRQGLWLQTRNIKRSLPAMRDMVKAATSEKFGQSLDDFYRGNIEKNIAPDPSWVKSQEHGLYYAPYKFGQGSLVQREEAFMSKWANKIPGIRVSERAYVTFLNKFRQDNFKYYSEFLAKKGAEDWEYDELAKFINIATGRGELGKLSTLSPFLSTALFSPRMQAATIELPLMLASKSPAVRRIAAENIGSTLAAGAGLLGLAALAGASVELDPRSSDFAKIRVGNTRIDIWAGKQQYNVLLARLLTGKGKSTTTGDLYEIGPNSFAGDKIALLTHFVRGKLAPGPGLVTDITTGEDFLGNPMTMERAPQIALNAAVPMSPQQTVESVGQDKAVGGLLSIPGYLGVGVSSYGGPVAKLQREWLSDFKPYNDIPSNNVERQAKLNAAKTPQERALYSLNRDAYRQRHPDVDAKLFVSGETSSLSTPQAVTMARKIILDNNIDPTTIDGVQKVIKEQEKRAKLGVRDTNITLTERFVQQLLAEKGKQITTPTPQTATPVQTNTPAQTPVKKPVSGVR